MKSHLHGVNFSTNVLRVFSMPSMLTNGLFQKQTSHLPMVFLTRNCFCLVFLWRDVHQRSVHLLSHILKSPKFCSLQTLFFISVLPECMTIYHMRTWYLRVARGYQIPQNQNYRWLLSLLGIKPGSCRRAASLLTAEPSFQSFLQLLFCLVF